MSDDGVSDDGSENGSEKESGFVVRQQKFLYTRCLGIAKQTFSTWNVLLYEVEQQQMPGQ